MLGYLDHGYRVLSARPTTDNTEDTDENARDGDEPMERELVHKELSEAIIGAAMTVLNALRPGLDEKLYENALAIELRNRGHSIEQQRQFPVHYDGQLIGTLIPDLIVDDLVIADPKVVNAFPSVPSVKSVVEHESSKAQVQRSAGSAGLHPAG